MYGLRSSCLLLPISLDTIFGCSTSEYHFPFLRLTYRMCEMYYSWRTWVRCVRDNVYTKSHRWRWFDWIRFIQLVKRKGCCRSYRSHFDVYGVSEHMCERYTLEFLDFISKRTRISWIDCAGHSRYAKFPRWYVFSPIYICYLQSAQWRHKPQNIFPFEVFSHFFFFRLASPKTRWKHFHSLRKIQNIFTCLNERGVKFLIEAAIKSFRSFDSNFSLLVCCNVHDCRLQTTQTNSLCISITMKSKL